MIRYLIAVSLTAYSLTAFSLTDPWGVNVLDHAAVQRTYKQGESWTMQISLRAGLSPLDITGATARWFWYTNAVDNLWWTNSAAITAPKSGIVSAEWTPAMDVGAASYPYWVGIWMPGATSPLWRVTGTIRMLPSPGFTPNALLPPVRTINFAAFATTNAPFATTNALESASNSLARTIQHGLTSSVPTQIAAAVAPLATTQQLAAAVLAVTTGMTWSAGSPGVDALRLVDSTNSPRQWIDATGGVWRVSFVTQEVYDAGWIRFTFDAGFGAKETEGPELTAPAASAFYMEKGSYNLDEYDAGQGWVFDGGDFGYRIEYRSGGDTISALWRVQPAAEDEPLPQTLTAYSGNAFGTASVAHYRLEAVEVTNLVDGVTFQSSPKAAAGIDPLNGTATNLSVRGWLALPQAQATNLVLRLVASNEYLIVEEVLQ